MTIIRDIIDDNRDDNGQLIAEFEGLGPQIYLTRPLSDQEKCDLAVIAPNYEIDDDHINIELQQQTQPAIDYLTSLS